MTDYFHLTLQVHYGGKLPHGGYCNTIVEPYSKDIIGSFGILNRILSLKRVEKKCTVRTTVNFNFLISQDPSSITGNVGQGAGTHSQSLI